MKKLITLLLFSFCLSSHASDTESLISIESKHSAKDTADKFESIIKSKGLTLFARIDHQKNAAGVDLKLRATEVIIFGNPKVGTPLMLCSQGAAIDLPQKMLISTDAEGKTSLTYNNPKYNKERHNIEGCDEVVGKISKVLNALATAASK